MYETIDIVIREKGSRVVKRRIEDLGIAAGKSASSITILNQAVTKLGTGKAVQQLSNAVKACAGLQNQLGAVGKAGQVLNTTLQGAGIQAGKRNLEGVGIAAEKSASNVNNLSRALTVVDTGGAAQGRGALAIRRNLAKVGDSAEKSAGGVGILNEALRGMGAGLTPEKVNRYVDAVGAAANKSAGGVGILKRALNSIGAGTGTVFQKLKQYIDEIWAAARRSAGGVGTLNRALAVTDTTGRTIPQIKRHIDGVGASARKSAGGVGILNAALKGMGAGLTPRKIKKYTDELGDSAQNAAKKVNFLRGALSGLSAALVGRQVWVALDSFVNLQNRLRAVGLEGQELTTVWDELLGVANSTRSSLEGSVELYARLAISSKELGTTQQELINFTESLNQAIILSGATAQEAQAGLIQLSQGMASGTLRGDELRSVLEQLPAVADVIAKHLGVTRGELRKMGAEGKITATTILDAFAEARKELEERFGKTIPTLSQSVQVLKNSWLVFVGQAGQAINANALLSRSIMWVADNLETIIKVLASVASGFLLVGVASKAIHLVTTAVKELNVAMATNPLGLFLVVLTSVVTALTLFRDEIKLGIDDTTSLGDLMRVIGEQLNELFDVLYMSAKETFGPAFDMVEDFLKDVDFSLAGVLRFTALVIDGFVAYWRGAFTAIIALFAQFPKAAGDLLVSGLNFLLKRVENFVNGVVDLLEPILNWADVKVEPISIELENTNKGAAKNYGENIGQAFVDGFTSSVPTATNYVEDLLERAQAQGKARLARDAAARKKADLGGARGDRPDAEGKAALSKALDQLVAKYDAVRKAQEQYVEAQTLLSNAEKAHLITGERRAELMAVITAQTKEARDPLGALNEQLDRESALMQMNSDQREIATRLRAEEQNLLSKGIILGDKEREQLQARLELLQQETKFGEVRAQILDNVRSKTEDYALKLQALNQLIGEGLISQGQAVDVVLEANADLLEGTVEAQEALVRAYDTAYQQIDLLRQQDLISDQSVAQAKAKLDVELLEARLKNAQDFFGNLSVLAQSSNSKIAAIGKAAAVTQATIDGVLAVQKALAAAPPPVNYALAAAVGAATAANVAKIMGLGFQTGGDFTVGGSGGPDSQMVAFRATPGEKVSVATPTQVRKGEKAVQAAAPVEPSIKIINTLDPAIVGNYLSSQEGERVIMNTIRSNPTELREISRG